MPINFEIDFPTNSNPENTDDITSYLSLLDAKRPLRHENYNKSIEHAREMAVHYSGVLPVDLIESYRPNEPKDIQEYRLNVYEPTTKSSADRTLNVLSKIQKSGNSSIDFPEETPNIIEENTLKKYLTIDYPEFKSFDKFLFGVMLKHSIIDPNSLALVKPLRSTENDTDFVQPIIRLFPSRNVVDKWESVYYTILLDEKSIIKKNGREVEEGNIYLFITKKNIIKAIQIEEIEGGKKIYDIIIEYEFDFDKTPAFTLKGDVVEDTFPYCYQSYTSGILPHWNKAIRLQSDQDAQFVMHAYLERYEMEIECSNGCTYNDDEGYHTVTLKNGSCRMCQTCQGSGKGNTRSPYGVTSIKKDMLEENPLFPGATYLEKPIDILAAYKEEINDQINSGFASINMEVLEKVGENQSGKAKLVDRDSLNDFLLKVSDNVFDNLMDNSITMINDWRYGFLPNTDEQLPKINKPTSFDIETAKTITESMQNLKGAGATPEAILLLQVDLIDKIFPNDQNKREFHKLSIKLDPLAGLSAEEKESVVLSQGTSQLSYIISSNTSQYIIRAIEENPDFLTLPFKDQESKMEEFAKQEIQTQQRTNLVDENGTKQDPE